MSQTELIQSVFSLPGGKGKYLDTLVEFLTWIAPAPRLPVRMRSTGSPRGITRQNRPSIIFLSCAISGSSSRTGVELEPSG